MTDWPMDFPDYDLERKRRRENPEQYRPDPKPTPRIKATKEEWEALRVQKLGSCRVCGSNWNVELHHLVGIGRAKAGDDMAANLVSLCPVHHQKFHAGDEHVAAMIGASLDVPELQYVLRKKGSGFLSRRYYVNAA